jgi:hypothetical protein
MPEADEARVAALLKRRFDSLSNHAVNKRQKLHISGGIGEARRFQYPEDSQETN